jgi:hypothetical protein
MTGTVAPVTAGAVGDLVAAAAGTEASASASAAQIPVPASPAPTARAVPPACARAAPAAGETPRIRSPPFASACHRVATKGSATRHDRAAAYGEINGHAPKTRRPEQDIFPAQAGY